MLRQRRVVVVGSGVIEETLCLVGSAMPGFPTEIQPALPIDAVIRFGLASELIRETEATSVGHECANV